MYLLPDFDLNVWRRWPASVSQNSGCLVIPVMSPREPPTDGELLRRAATGDRDAFSVLYVRYEAIVAGYLVRRTRDPELAADLTAETFAAAIVGAGGFRDEGQSAVGWLLGIARNLLARTWQRGEIERRARQRLGVEAVAVSDPSLERVEALIDDADPSNPLLVTLDALPETQREAIRAHVLDEQSYAALAQELGVPEATVRQRVSRGLARLRTTLEGRPS
jgi:RNA polymerase sigma factor (sigma-70 family)